MSKPKLLIALTSTHGIMPASFLDGMIDLVANLKVPGMIQQFINCYVNLSSNVAAAKLLKSDCTHLLLVDVDIVVRAASVERLLSHDVDIVGAFFPKKKQGKLEWVAQPLPDKPNPDERGLVELKTIGAGCLLIKREVFDAMRDAFPIDYKEYETDEPLWDFFPMGVVDDRYLMHDWYFCHRAAKIGYKIYGDTKVQLGHIGNVMFPLESQKDDVRE